MIELITFAAVAFLGTGLAAWIADSPERREQRRRR